MGCAELPDGGVPPGTASHEDQDRLLQRWSGKGQFENVAFDFLGYGFRPRSVKGPASQRMFCGYTPAVSKPALNTMRSKIRSMNLRRRTEVTLDDIAAS